MQNQPLLKTYQVQVPYNRQDNRQVYSFAAQIQNPRLEHGRFGS